MRAVIYSRVSTQAQASEGYSLAEQEAVLRAYTERYGLEIVEHVSDEGISGTLARRPGLNRIRELARSAQVQVLVCLKLDRLSRKAWLGEQIWDELRSLGVKVVFTDQKFDDTPVGDFTRGIMGHVAQLELATITERMKAGKAGKARAGRYPAFLSILGYDVIRRWEEHLPGLAGQSGNLRINEAEAALVRRIFQAYAEGSSLRALARTLNSEGVGTKAGYSWASANLLIVLRQTAYVGRLYYGKKRSALGPENEDGERKRRFVAAEGEPILIRCPAIITEELWDRAQARLDTGKLRAGRPTKSPWSLAGIVYCGSCTGRRGTPPRYSRLIRSGTVGYRPNAWYLECTTRRRVEVETCNGRWKHQVIEARVDRAVREYLAPGRLAALARQAVEAEAAQAGDLGREVSRLKSALTKLQREEEKLLDAALKGFSAELVEGRLKDLQRRRAATVADLSAAERQRGQSETPAAAAVRVERLATELRRRYEEAQGDQAKLNTIYRVLIRVVLTPTECDIQLRREVLAPPER